MWNKASYTNSLKEHEPYINETSSNRERLLSVLALKKYFKEYMSSEAGLDLLVRSRRATIITKEVAFDMLVLLLRRLKANIGPLTLHY
jgi:hypothetical protein